MKEPQEFSKVLVIISELFISALLSSDPYPLFFAISKS